MLNTNKEVRLQVIGFDRDGENWSVYHPLMHNQNIPWSEGINETTVVDHD